MQMRRLWTLPLLLGCLSVAMTTDLGAQAPEKSPVVEHKELDAAIFKTMRTVINQGADLYNSGDWAGCYRLYEGALVALRPLLEHHPELVKNIDMALITASRAPQLGDRAFVLRKAIDEIRKETGPAAATGPETIKTPPTPKGIALWDRLGGEKGVTRIIDNFVTTVIRDPRVNFFRKPNAIPDDKQLAALKRHLVEYISSVTGGPYDYKGKNMKEVHKGMGITNAEFDAAETHLRTALQINGALPDDIILVMRFVETTRSDIVQPKLPPPPPTTAWQRLGGEKGAARIVDDIVDPAIKDPKVNFYGNPQFVPSPESVILLKAKFVEQLSNLTGGPPQAIQSMRVAHRGRGITNAEFDVFLGYIRKALKNNNVNDADLKTIMTKYSDMRPDIVGMRTDPVDPFKPIDKKPKDKKDFDKKDDDKKPDDKKPKDKKDFDKKPKDKKDFDKKDFDKKPDYKKPDDKKDFDDKKNFDKKPKDKKDFDKKDFDKKDFDKKPDDKKPSDLELIGTPPKEKSDDK
jgi:hemoglobin